MGEEGGFVAKKSQKNNRSKHLKQKEKQLIQSARKKEISEKLRIGANI